MGRDSQWSVAVHKEAFFESERLLYRGISEQDAECLVKWRSDGGLVRYFRRPRPVSLDKHLEWFRTSYMKDPGRFDFMIWDKVSKKGIGTVGVSALDYSQRSCEISYMIGEKTYQRKGLASEAVSALLDYMKQQERIRIFYAEVHEDNMASIRTVERLGFLQYSWRGEFVLFRREFL